MHFIFSLIALVAAIASFVCWLIILVDAFKDSVIKGLLGLLYTLYLLWYAIFDFEHDNKWQIVILGIFGGGIAAAIARMG